MSTKNKLFTIPNILTFSRICLIPFFIYFYINKIYNFAFILFLISGVTDILDGIIARQFDMISDYGKVLDPLADKLTLITLISCLYYSHNVNLFILLFVLAKEIFQIIGGTFLFKKGLVVSSNIFGKVTTCLFYLGIGLIFLFRDKPYGTYCLMIAICSALVAFIVYFIGNKKKYNIMKEIKNDKTNEI